MVTQGTCRGMTAHDGGLADLQGIVETLLTCMAEVNHHTHSVHLLNHLFAELAHTTMFVIASCGVADVVVAIVAEGHIHHTTLSEGFHIANVFTNGVTVLNAEHDGAFAIFL